MPRCYQRSSDRGVFPPSGGPSLMMLPLLISTTLSAMREISRLCVTTRTARSGRGLVDQQLQYLRARPEIELAGGLVGKQYGITRGERPCYGDALLLAARQLVGEVVSPMAKADGFQHRCGIGAATFSSHIHAKLDVLQGREAREEVEALEYEAHGLAPEREEL